MSGNLRRATARGAMAATRSRVASDISSRRPLTTLDTVVMETPARLAISRNVTRPSSAMSCQLVFILLMILPENRFALFRIVRITLTLL